MSHAGSSPFQLGVTNNRTLIIIRWKAFEGACILCIIHAKTTMYIRQIVCIIHAKTTMYIRLCCNSVSAIQAKWANELISVRCVLRLQQWKNKMRANAAAAKFVWNASVFEKVDSSITDFLLSCVFT